MNKPEWCPADLWKFCSDCGREHHVGLHAILERQDHRETPPPRIPEDITHMPVSVQRHWLRLENKMLKEKIATHKAARRPQNYRNIDKELYGE